MNAPTSQQVLTTITDLARESLKVDAYCVEIDALFPSPTNPRTHFPEDELRDLARSIAAVGVMQPILARPIPHEMKAKHATRAELEIVSGERRWRASRLAGLIEVPVIVRHIPDDVLIAMQIIENLQREGLSAIEEAEGYGKLQEQGLSPVQIAAQVGKSKAYIYAKLKLLKLCQIGRDKVRAGVLSESIGLLISRIPVEALQIKAVELVTKPDYENELPSYRHAARLIQSHFTARLSRAWFEQDDATLQPEEGACTTCASRLGNDPACEPQNADVCINPPCFQRKQDAHQVRLRINYRAAGLATISGGEAKKIKPHNYSGIEGGYVGLNEKCYELEGQPTYRSLLEKVHGTVHPALLDVNTSQTGLIEIVDKKALSEALRARGFDLVIRDTSKQDAERAREEAELKADNAFRRRLFDEVRQQPILMLTTPDLSMIADFALERLYEEYRYAVGQLWYPDEKRKTSVERLFEKIPNMTDTELMLLLRDILLMPETKRSSWDKSPPTRLLEAAERIGIDPERIKSDLNRKSVTYRNPNVPGTTWNGKGKKPLWVEAWEATGKSIEELAIEIDPLPEKSRGKK